VARLRLLKVMVQPIFVLDDGEQLTEMSAQPVAVPPGDWPTFASTKFLQGVAALAQQIGADVSLSA